MSSNSARPKWWQLYLTLPVLVVLFALDGRLRVSARGHQVVQIAIVLVVYGLIHVWVKANAEALSSMDQRRQYGSFRVIEIPPYEISSTGDDINPILQLPDSEIKGVLSDTMEMNYIDAKAFPVDEVSHELKKE